MKSLLSLALLLACSLPAFATHGIVRQRVVVRQPVVRQRVVVQRQRVFVPHVQQVVVPQAIYAAPLQLNSGCYQNGALQLNAGGCQQLYR